MPAKRLSEDQIRVLLHGYVANGHNVTTTHRATGFSRNAIYLYVDQWLAGELKHIDGLPPAPTPEPVEAPETDGLAATYGLKRRIAALERERDALLKEQEESARLMEMFGFIRDARVEAPTWTMKRPKRGSTGAIPTAFLSDVHLDEVVRPEQINWVNGFDRDIAEKRLRLFFENTIRLAQDYLHGLTYEGIVLPLGGDLFSGIIHEELIETNAATIFESLLHWSEPMVAGIRLFRDAFGRVFLPCVVGNHGRRQRKPHAKNRAQDNFDWFFYHLLSKLLSGEKGIEFTISEAADQPYQVYSTRYLLTHGDQFRGGSGIAGMLSPLLLGDSRKRERENAVKRPYDYLIMGHWHQLAFLRGLIVNGSVKGYDEYAYVSNFRFEPPRQAFWITDANDGVTITAPIHVQAKDEAWMNADTGPIVKTMGAL